MFAYLHAQMCTHSLCVRAVKTLASVRMRAYRAASIKKAHAASIKKAHASVHTCAHWPESSLLIHTKNVCTCVHASVRMCVHTFFVCTSSEDSGQCVHMCSHWPDVFTPHTHKECVHMFAYLHAQMCTHSLCVRAVKTLASVRMRAYRAASIKKAHAASIKKAHASVHTCAHWPESSLLIHTKNVCTCVHASVRMCVHTFFVCTSSEDSGQCVHMCSHWPESSLLIHTKNVCTCLHTCMHKCAHILCVYEQ